ncbi:MAG: hypothetical protein JEY94_19170 [Melioribacteraceae bacterium]|nr:hypothetical protein [Melioribacteraceae bacterium]
MKVVEIKHVEDCFDGSLIKEILLSDEITKEFIHKLSGDDFLQYFPHFARPFFKIRKNGTYDIKGIEGNNTMRIHLKKPDEYSLNEFIEMVNNI